MDNNMQCYAWLYDTERKPGKSTARIIVTVLMVFSWVVMAICMAYSLTLDVYSRNAWVIVTFIFMMIATMMLAGLASTKGAAKRSILDAFGVDGYGRLFHFNLNHPNLLTAANMQNYWISPHYTSNGLLAVIREAEDARRRVELVTAMKTFNMIPRILNQNLAEQTGIRINKILDVSDCGVYVRLHYTYISGSNNREKKRKVCIYENMENYEMLKGYLMQYMQYTSNR